MSNKSVRNEKRKLSATFANGMAIASFAIGIISPIVSVGSSGWSELTVWTGVSVLGCSFLAMILHWVARKLVEGIEE